MRVFGKSCRLSLLRGEVALLLFGKFEQTPRRFLTNLGHMHNTTTNLKYCVGNLREMFRPQYFQDDPRAHTFEGLPQESKPFHRFFESEVYDLRSGSRAHAD